MAAVDADLADGFRLYHSTDGATYSELVDIDSVGSPGNPERPEIDVSPLYSTVTKRQFRMGKSNSGMWEFKQYWNKTRWGVLKAYYDANTNVYWRAVYPDNDDVSLASKDEFRGYVKKLLSVGTLDDPDTPMISEVSIKIDGDVTFTAGT